MVENLTEHAKEKLDGFKASIQTKKDVSHAETTIQEECLISIAESLLIIAEKLGKRYI